MPKVADIEAAVARLAALKPDSADLLPALAGALASKQNLIVAQAAKTTARYRLTVLADDLEKAFARLLAAPATADKGCLAKIALADALKGMECSTEQAFLLGVRHVQLEPTWGGKSDSAGPVRAACAAGLVQMGSPAAPSELSDLLMDADPQVRLAAARGLGETRYEDAALPLRVKLLAGDSEPEVLAECMIAALRLSPRRCLPLVERFLDSPDDGMRDLAAVALGTSRLAETFEILRTRFERDVISHSRNRLIAPMALLKRPEAVDFLIALVESASQDTAVAAVTALATYRHDAQTRTRVASAVAEQENAELSAAFIQAFGEA